MFLLLGAVLCVRLGLWQRDRLLQRRARNAIALELRRQPPVLLDASWNIPLVGRRVEAHGTWDRQHEFILRGQAIQGEPGVRIITVLQIPGRDSAVLVDRGFLPAADAMTPRTDGLDEPGRVTVHGVGLAILPTNDGGAPLDRDGRTTWRALDLPALRARVPYPVQDILIQQVAEPGVPALPRRLPVPSLDDGPHLSYMLQWFAFASIAVVGAGVVLTRPRAA